MAAEKNLTFSVVSVMALSARFITTLQNGIVTVYHSMPNTYLPTLHHELLTIKLICQEQLHGRKHFS